MSLSCDLRIDHPNTDASAVSIHSYIVSRSAQAVNLLLAKKEKYPPRKEKEKKKERKEPKERKNKEKEKRYPLKRKNAIYLF